MSTDKDLKKVKIYTDGGCIGNPGPGGYGVVLLSDKRRKELSGGFKLTTNNRMEIIAAIEGLNSLKKPCAVKLYSDSRYVVDSVSLGWAKKWKKNNWWRTKSEKAKNSDLWELLLLQCEIHEVEFIWVKGHAGNKENERCDELSYQAAEKDNLVEDEGYDPNAKTGKIKITQEGQPCRKCETPVVKKIPKRKNKNKQNYYYEYYLYCTNCDTMYMIEEAKRKVEKLPPEQLSF